MKAMLIVSGIILSNFSILLAKDLSPYEDTFINNLNDKNQEANFNQEMKLSYVTKLMERQQKSYDEKITFLEAELRKTKDQLLEKSLNQEKLESTLKTKYGMETLALKKELAYKVKSILDYQRQIEKMNPSEDLKNVIKMNTDMASELRKSEDRLAIFQLKQVEQMRGSHSGGARLPASVNEDK